MRLILFILLTLMLYVFSYSQTVYLNGRQFDNIEDQWYQVDNGKNYQVDNSVITVKFKATTTESQKTSFNQSQGVQVMRTNILGYADLQIQAQSDPITIVQNYLNSGLVDVAEPNTYGESTIEPNDFHFPDSMHVGRAYHHSVLLQNQKALIIGGSKIKSCELL